MATKPADAVELSNDDWYLVHKGQVIGLCRDCWQPRPRRELVGALSSLSRRRLLSIGPEGIDETEETWYDEGGRPGSATPVSGPHRRCATTA